MEEVGDGLSSVAVSEFVDSEVEVSLEFLVALFYAFFDELYGFVGHDALSFELDGFLEESLVVWTVLVVGLRQLCETFDVPLFKFLVDDFKLVHGAAEFAVLSLKV